MIDPQTSADPFAETTLERSKKVWATVARVPPGRVASYGQIAELAGFPRHARFVGYALRHLPDDLSDSIPWHRIINARGELSFPPQSDAYRRQRQRLEDEGVVFRANRVDLTVYGWKLQERSLDEFLWKSLAE